MSIRERTDLIAQFQKEIETYTGKVEQELLLLLLQAATELYKDAYAVEQVFAKYNLSKAELIALMGERVLDIVETNILYFETLSENALSRELIADVTKVLYDAFGIEPIGNLKTNGYLYNLLKDNTVERQVINYLTTNITAKLDPNEFTKGFKPLILGEDEGILQRFFNGLETIPLYDADRISQDQFSTKLGFQAAIYTGGVIASSRPFCRERNGKVFLKKEIALFGSDKDKYGGYSNKASGAFAGKPKSGYNPFADLGGYNCRHFLSYISNAEALRQRPDLKEKDGELV